MQVTNTTNMENVIPPAAMRQGREEESASMVHVYPGIVLEGLEHWILEYAKRYIDLPNLQHIYR